MHQRIRRLPARNYVVNGDRRSFALLRPIADIEAQNRIRELMLEAEYPSAAESVREGLDETLTVLTNDGLKSLGTRDVPAWLVDARCQRAVRRHVREQPLEQEHGQPASPSS